MAFVKKFFNCFITFFGVKHHQIKQDSCYVTFQVCSHLTTCVMINVFCSRGCVNVHACLMLFMTDTNWQEFTNGGRMPRGLSLSNQREICGM